MAAHIETGTMVAPRYRSQTLDHLGLVAGMYEELGIGERIDQVIEQDCDKRQVSVGQAVKAMVLNGLGFVNQRLYLMPKFFWDKPTERLVGEGIRPEQLNDDVLGRALDALYKFGVTELYALIAPQAVKRLGLPVRFAQFDSTGFHVDGDYNSETGAEEGDIHLTRGYSRDHRPDLNQVVLQLIVERQAGLPLMMQPLDGNAEDKTHFRQTLQAYLGQLRTTYQLEYVVADSALYTAETLPLLQETGWITRVPATLKAAQKALRQADPETLTRLDEQTRYQRLTSDYAGVSQRWLVVYSEAAHQRALNTVPRQCLKHTQADAKAFAQLGAQSFACVADAEQALTAFQNTLTLTTVAEPRIVAVPHYHGPGRPAKDRSPDAVSYRIEGALASLPGEYTARLRQHSGFILATNQLDTHALSDVELLQAYKAQHRVERGFRFLKDPLFLASSLYLKSPQRIMALMGVMTLCLLVYAALEHRLRERLQAQGQTFPHQTGKPVQNPTARWVFQCFVGIHLLILADGQALVLNLNEHHQSLLELLGYAYEAFYS
jgi:transposase